VCLLFAGGFSSSGELSAPRYVVGIVSAACIPAGPDTTMYVCLLPAPLMPPPPHTHISTGGFSGSGELSAPRYVVDEAGNLLYEYDTAYIENRCGHTAPGLTDWHSFRVTQPHTSAIVNMVTQCYSMMSQEWPLVMSIASA
jgi:hypothetical protein